MNVTMWMPRLARLVAYATPRAWSTVVSRVTSSLTRGTNPTKAALPLPALVLSGLIGLPSVSVAALAAYDEGFRRSATFWVNAFPIYLHYRVTQMMVEGKPEDEQDAAFDELHTKYADDLLRIILTLKGFYIKIGQIGATRPDFMPPQFISKLETLQDQVPPEDISYVKSIISESLDRPCDEIFKEFDEKCLGAASIGQVHRAVLHDGREVVVKVKFPNVEDTFGIDMQTITSFCELAQPEQVPFLREVRKQFATEFDYEREAMYLNKIYDNLMPNYSHRISVPRSLTEYCTKDVLVMEYLPGIKLVDGLRNYFKKVALQRNTTIEAMEKERKRKMELGIMEQGPSSQAMSWYIRLAKAKAALTNLSIFAFNWSAGWFTEPRLYIEPDLPLNLPEILQTLMDVHAHQIFQDGCFNGDPHPGNILLLPDGRLGLIDFGQVKELPVEDRIQLARLIVALADEDEDKVFQVHHEMGFRTEKGSKYVSYRLATIGFNRDDAQVTEGMNLQSYFEHLGKLDPVTESADQYVMASRVSLLLRGLGLHLSYPMHTAVMWKAAALQFLKEQNVDP
eukprot:m.62438 g.62438  ORF g.62438 m.62438 type:complete len:567 (+) comp11912_c0_seq2:1558-3258(+)